MPNRLASETSPYLLQHANNPVDWFPWGDEALQLAQSHDRPIFLSIGYSACHWCHVMEHESFESQEIADYLNQHFVPIKVDREERPDLDQIYMNAVQLLTGRGGWPMSVFLTPELHPFFGGTYWPPTASRGMPGFDQVLRAVVDAWENRRDAAREQSQKLTEKLRVIAAGSSEPGEVPAECFQSAWDHLTNYFDRNLGGWGDAPKFPHTINVDLLLSRHARQADAAALEMVTLTLDKMSRGGIYDHLGGGFARYSVDSMWLVPHFEKMLYDNALLIGNYVDAWRVTQNPEYQRVARESCDYILRDMTDPQGGFHSTEDADSEGEEGKFYVWTPHEVEQLLKDASIAENFCRVYDVTVGGNFEGHSILNLKQPLEQFAQKLGMTEDELANQMANSRQVLFHAREDRVRPAKDDKILTSWNGLMIEALAKAGAAFDCREYLAAAENAADFLLGNLREEDGRLLHAWRQGKAKQPAFLDDYAFLASGLFALHQATFSQRWLDAAIQLMDAAIKHFHDPNLGGFFYTANDHEQLIARHKEFYDQSIPSSSGMAATVLAKLGTLLGNAAYLDLAHETVRSGSEILGKHAIAAGQLLLAHDFLTNGGEQLVVVAPERNEELGQVLQKINSSYLPHAVLALKLETEAAFPALEPLFAGKEPVNAAVAVYSCKDFSCRQPQTAQEFLSE